MHYFLMINMAVFDATVVTCYSGVTTRGAVRQLPQGAWRRGAPWADESR